MYTCGQELVVSFILRCSHPHVESVLFGKNGVASSLTEGKIVIDMSSISPIDTKKYASRINELGCQYLDAPVSGGEEATFEKAKPLFDLMGGFASS